MFLCKTLATFLFVFVIKEVASYPHFVGYGYTSCITCHYNPYGNGPLNNYGRALGATAVSARWLVPDYVEEETIAKNSSFFGVSPSSWIQPSFDYRGLLLKRDFREESEDTEWIDMMADLNLVVRTDQTNRYFFSATFGYAPTPTSLENTGQEVENYRWRDYYLGLRPGQNWGVYLGLMDKIYGIRIAEHTNFSRSITNLTQNDQSHGIQFHYTSSNFEIGIGGFAGNLIQDSGLRQVGASGKFDYVMPHKGKMGVSALKSESEYLDMYMWAFHYQTSVGKDSSILAEYGKVVKSSISTNDEQEQDYGLGQAYLNVKRGVFIINSLEYLKESNGDYRIRFGPGFQIFPHKNIEFRFELYNSRSFSDSSSTRDTWDLLSQVHLWF